MRAKKKTSVVGLSVYYSFILRGQQSRDDTPISLQHKILWL
jgi:hypothetical protein